MQPLFGFFPSAHFQTVIPYVSGYLAVAVLLILWGGYDRLAGGKLLPKTKPEVEDEDEEQEE